MTGTPRPEPVFTKQQRIAELAGNCPDMAFTTLAHHIDIEWMLTAHARTRKDGAAGVDGQTADEYGVKCAPEAGHKNGRSCVMPTNQHGRGFSIHCCSNSAGVK